MEPECGAKDGTTYLDTHSPHPSPWPWPLLSVLQGLLRDGDFRGQETEMSGVDRSQEGKWICGTKPPRRMCASLL